MIIFAASLLTIGVLVFILSVRAKDLPEPEPVSPFEHLDERKAAIYENLRDLQFEYRVGKLSDVDYHQTKPAKKQQPQRFICPSCNAEFPTPLKFCGECGKPMAAAQA